MENNCKRKTPVYITMEDDGTDDSEDLKSVHDVTLLIGDQRFPCSKKTLAENSDYFKAMFYSDFVEKNKDSVELQDVDPSAMDIVLKALIIKSPDFTKCSKILNVLETSCMFQFNSIRDQCIEFIVNHWMDCNTFLSVKSVANKMGLLDLQNMAESLALWNFKEVKKTDTFLDLSTDELISYLDDDRLNVTDSEFEVFEAGCNWIDKNPDERLFFSLNILKTIRFKYMSTFDIKSMLHYSSVRDTPQSELIIECIYDIRNDVLNESCVVCNAVEDDDRGDRPESPHSPISFSPSSSFKFIRSFKRKRRTTSQCSCFDTCTVMTAQKLLDRNKRMLPMVPCFVGVLPMKNKDLDDDWTQRNLVNERISVNDKNKCPYIFQWNGSEPDPIIHLSKIDDGPTGAIGFKVVVKDFNFYIMGGEYMMGYGTWNTSIWKYDTLRGTWEFETSLTAPRRHHSACILNDDLYIIGGIGKHRVMLNNVVRYNLMSKDWETCTSLPTALYNTACCVYKNEIFLFGLPVMCFRPDTNIWEEVNDIELPGNAAIASAIADDNLIYLITMDTSDLYCFEPYQKHIVIEHLGKFKACGKDACIINNLIYAFGEEDDHQIVEVYDIDNREFRMLWKSKSEFIVINQGYGCFALPKYH
uniref:BTB domain-containing protein n=4 Tax=Clastoptera arizonana TaxID=38151 RepID=A0A1B6EGB5_9HEMI